MIIPIHTYYRDGYWCAVVSAGHPLAGVKSMHRKKKHALRIVSEVARSLPVDGAEHSAASVFERMQETAKRLVSEFAA